MRHHSCLLATTEVPDELPKTHSVGKKGTKRKKWSCQWRFFIGMPCTVSKQKPKYIFQQKERRWKGPRQGSLKRTGLGMQVLVAQRAHGRHLGTDEEHSKNKSKFRHAYEKKNTENLWGDVVEHLRYIKTPQYSSLYHWWVESGVKIELVLTKYLQFCRM